MDTLFAMPVAVRLLIAIMVVLALVAAAAWAVRRFGGSRLRGAGSRGRQPRLAVIDAASVDARRRLLLIRRDNDEHLLIVGGPTDLVIEPNIVRIPTGPDAACAENDWALQPVGQQRSRDREVEEHWTREPPPRPRTAETVEGSKTPLSERRSTELTPEAAEPEPRPHGPAPLDTAPDQNLAEIASRLEKALRDEAQPPALPRAMPKVKLRIDPRIEAPSRPKRDAMSEPMAPRPDAKPEVAARSHFYDNLEEEIASLLGRAAGKS